MNAEMQQRRALRAPGTRLNWRPNGASCFESNWSILQKLAHLNEVNADVLCEALAEPAVWFRSGRQRNVSFSLHEFGLLSRKRLRWWLNLDRDTVEYSVIAPYLPKVTASSRRLYQNRPAAQQCRTLRFCLDCFANGFHSPLYQVNMITRCPIHGSPFEYQCPNYHCKRRIPYQASCAMLAAPYRCPYCDALFWNGLNKSVWTPGLSEADRDKFSRYVDWIATVEEEAREPGWSLGFEAVAKVESDVPLRVLRYLNDLQPLDGWGRDFYQGPSESVCRHVIAGEALRPVDVEVESLFADDARYRALVSLSRDFHVIYKSVRRHLKRRYVKGHANCNRLVRTPGASIVSELHCRWVNAYGSWRKRHEHYIHSRWVKEEAAYEWKRKFLRNATFLQEILRWLPVTEEPTTDERAILTWVGGRWYAFRLLATFRAMVYHGVPWSEGPPGVPFLYWQPATPSRPHAVTWWTSVALTLPKDAHTHGAVGRSKLRRLLREAKERLEEIEKKKPKMSSRRKASDDDVKTVRRNRGSGRALSR